MFWDGEKTPSVEVPVGDFFAVGFGFSAKVNSALICIDHQPGRLTDSAAFGAAPLTRGSRTGSSRFPGEIDRRGPSRGGGP